MTIPFGKLFKGQIPIVAGPLITASCLLRKLFLTTLSMTVVDILKYVLCKLEKIQGLSCISLRDNDNANNFKTIESRFMLSTF